MMFLLRNKNMLIRRSLAAGGSSSRARVSACSSGGYNFQQALLGCPFSSSGRTTSTVLLQQHLRRTISGDPCSRAFFSTSAADTASSATSSSPATAVEKSAPPASTSEQKSSGASSSGSTSRPAPGIFSRAKSFTFGVIFASGVSFWVLLLEGQKMLDRLETSVQKVLEYQTRVERRLDRVETALAV
ncbi:unnamed protein product [Amoebophrya sp. A120]|nr:unnamed protein product [Amoebophrya sp. A120]|eukprot:GSA120T00010088001.1